MLRLAIGSPCSEQAEMRAGTQHSRQGAQVYGVARLPGSQWRRCRAPGRRPR